MLTFESMAYGLACVAFTVLSVLFYVLYQNNVRGSIECDEAAKFLAEYEELEDPVDAAARFLRMSKEDVTLEIKRGRILKLVSMKVASTATALKSPFPVIR